MLPKQAYAFPAYLVLTALSLTSCGGGTTVETPDAKVVVNNDGTVKAPTKDSALTITSGSGRFPVAFPLPQYPGSSCTMTVSSKMSYKDSGEGETVMLSTADTIAKVMDYYKKWFDANGWKIDAKLDSDMTGFINASKGSTNASISAVATPGGTGPQTAINLIVKGN